MSLVKWESSLEVGVQSIDDDHRNIVAWINDLHAMGSYNFPHRTLVYVLDSLADYVDAHFRREERAMSACGYDGIEAHKRAHVGFESYVHKLREQVLADKAATVSEDVIKKVVEWLADHITGLDRLMVNAIRGNAAALSEADQSPGNIHVMPSAHALRNDF